MKIPVVVVRVPQQVVLDAVAPESLLELPEDRSRFALTAEVPRLETFDWLLAATLPDTPEVEALLSVSVSDEMNRPIPMVRRRGVLFGRHRHPYNYLRPRVHPHRWARPSLRRYVAP